MPEYVLHERSRAERQSDAQLIAKLAEQINASLRAYCENMKWERIEPPRGRRR